MNVFHYLSLTVIVLLALPAQAKLSIFTCEPEWASLAEALGGIQVDTFSATNGQQDPHHIQAKPSLIAKLRNADMIACTGADLEAGWLPVLLRRAANPGTQPGKPGYFIATQYVRMLGIPKQLDRSQGDLHAAGNPHIQTSPENILPVAKAMSARLIQLDSANSPYYQQQLVDFNTRWKAALVRWKTIAKPLRHIPIVVHHESWIYLEDWLNLDKLATLEDKPGLPPTSGHLGEILTLMETRPAKIIIHSAYQSKKPARWLSGKTGIPVVTLPSTIGGTEKATDLFALYDNILELLLHAVPS